MVDELYVITVRWLIPLVEVSWPYDFAMFLHVFSARCPGWKILDIDSPYDFRLVSMLASFWFLIWDFEIWGMAPLGRIELGSHPSDYLWYDLGQISSRRPRHGVNPLDPCSARGEEISNTWLMLVELCEWHDENHSESPYHHSASNNLIGNRWKQQGSP